MCLKAGSDLWCANINMNCCSLLQVMQPNVLDAYSSEKTYGVMKVYVNFMRRSVWGLCVKTRNIFLNPVWHLFYTSVTYRYIFVNEPMV
jgi:hypothetical protein